MQAGSVAGVLAGLSAQELEQLVGLGAVLQYDAGEVIIREQSIGREWYVVLEGLVRVDLDPATLGMLKPGSTDPHPILTLGPGGGFGELALLDAAPRSATVVALHDATRLLVITAEAFDALLSAGNAIAVRVLRGIVGDLALKLRHTRQLLLEQLAASHHIRVLCEELVADCALVDPLAPLQKTVVIREREAFVLGELAAARGAAPTKEILDVLIFAEPGELHALLAHGEPAGEVILHGLCSLLRHGQLPPHSAHQQLSYRFAPGRGRRAGSLLVARGPQHAPVRLDWEVKGWRLDGETNTARASLCLSITAGAGAEPGARAAALITGTTMPIQDAVAAQLRREGVSGAGYRMLAVHHRTHEVARTLQALRELGFELDAFVGIPYGEASWATSLMLDHASGHRYLCLQAVPHPSGPTSYRFDWLQSSFLPDDREQEIARLYADPANTRSYRGAMEALLTDLLEQAIRVCRERGERLLLYEDGAYLTPLIYAIAHAPEHPLHALVRAAVDSGLLAGSVEVTSSGERAQAAVIRTHGGRALLPVVSGARDEVKLLFEAVGVAEAVLQAASTALGNLGLPTFGFRRVAVLGGNGAIGVRLVEQLAQRQRGVEQLFVVDPAPNPFRCAVPVDDTTAIAARLRYEPLPRYAVAGGYLLISVPLDNQTSAETVAECILAALDTSAPGDEVIVRPSAQPSGTLFAAAWGAIERRSGYELAERTVLDGGVGVSVLLRRVRASRRVTVLGPQAVPVFASLQPLIHAGVDTVIGVTGTAAFGEADFDAFLSRPCAPGGGDDLVLISGSSKDYEFQRAIALLEDHRQRQDDGMGRVSGSSLAGFHVRKCIYPDVGTIFHLSREGVHKRLILLADGFVVNFFARYEKGVKTEYMDPVMTMQLLGLLRLAGAGSTLAPGLHQAKDVLPSEQIRVFWHALNTNCLPKAPLGSVPPKRTALDSGQVVENRNGRSGARQGPIGCEQGGQNTADLRSNAVGASVV